MAARWLEDFGLIAFKTVRDLMIRGYEHPKFGPQESLSRGVVNMRMKRVRRMFRWAVEHELVPHCAACLAVGARPETRAN